MMSLTIKSRIAICIVVLVICHPLAHIAGLLNVFWETIALVGLVMIALAVLLILVILRWGLGPITSLTRRMDQISGRHLQQPASLLLKGPPELKSFVLAWNRMLERLALAMQQQHRFTADASHELRTPLAIVKSTLQCARSQKRTISSYETSIDQSLEDLARLEHLLEQLLALARLDNISAQYEHTVIDMDILIDAVCAKHVELVAQRGDVLKWHTCAAQVMGSHEQLERMISNLVDNAVKYGPPGGKITVDMTCSGATLTVRVHDEGGRIPHDRQKHIFERFYRIRGANAQTTSGSGLGLALAREIAVKHGGTIRVDSNPGLGTDFTVSLPLYH